MTILYLKQWWKKIFQWNVKMQKWYTLGPVLCLLVLSCFSWFYHARQNKWRIILVFSINILLMMFSRTALTEVCSCCCSCLRWSKLLGRMQVCSAAYWSFGKTTSCFLLNSVCRCWTLSVRATLYFLPTSL